MIKISLLITAVATLFVYMLPGFILRKTKIADDKFAKNLSNVTLYVAQVCLLLHGFITAFDMTVFKNMLITFAVVFVIHIFLYFFAKGMFKKAPDGIRKILRFSLVFSNAGYMGIPIINDVLGADYTVYASMYVVVFNIFVYSLGRLIYTEDKSYISVKKMIINPAVIPIAIGFVIYVTGLGGYMQSAALETGFLAEASRLIITVISSLKNLVAPLSMMVIGVKLADIKFKGIFRDKYMYIAVATRLLILPTIIFVGLKGLNLVGFLPVELMSVVLILCSTPAAAVTTMFAEIFNLDGTYSGKIVAINTVLSIVTMPLIGLLLYI